MKRLLPIALVLAGVALWLWMARSPGRLQQHESAAAPPVTDRPVAAPEVAAESTLSAARVPLEPAAEPAPAEPAVAAAPAPAPSAPEAANAWFHGLAVDALSGLPIAGARAVVPRGEARPPPEQLAGDAIASEALSDERGLFRLVLSSRSDVGRAFVLAAGYGAGAFVFSADHDVPERAQLIELLPSVELEVRVTDFDGRPQVVGVAVSWPAETKIRAGGSSIFSVGEHARWSAATGEDGLARFAGLPAETTLVWQLEASAQQGRFALAPREQRRIDVVLGAGARIHGCVRDERGVPVAGLELGLAPPGTRPRAAKVTEVQLPLGRARKRMWTCRTDDQGCYELDEVPFETFEMVPGAPSDLVLVGDTTVTVDRFLIELDLIATSGLFISGRIVGRAEGENGPEFLTVKREDGSHVLEDFTWDETFRVGPLAPGEYLLRAGSGESGTAVVRAAAGATDVELRVAPVREISIAVAGADGAYEVTTTDLESQIKRFWSQDGRRIRVEWPHGAHALLLTTLDDRIGVLPRVVVDAEHPSGDLAVALEPGAHATIVHRATGGVRTLRVLVAGEPFPMPYLFQNELTAGASTTLLLPAGPLAVELVEEGRVVAREEAQLLAGEHRRIVLVPP